MKVKSKAKGKTIDIKKTSFFDKDDFVIDKKKKKVHLKDRYFDKLPKNLDELTVKRVFEYDDQYTANVIETASKYLDEDYKEFDTTINHGAGLVNDKYTFIRKGKERIVEHTVHNPNSSLTAAALKVFESAKK